MQAAHLSRVKCPSPNFILQIMVNLVEYLCDLIITMVYIESVSRGFYDMTQMDKVANIRLYWGQTFQKCHTNWILRREDYSFISNNTYLWFFINLWRHFMNNSFFGSCPDFHSRCDISCMWLALYNLTTRILACSQTRSSHFTFPLIFMTFFEREGKLKKKIKSAKPK